MKQILKEKAIELRKAGWSYNMIVDEIGVSKSSLSLWLREIPYKPNKAVEKRVNDSLLAFVMSRHEVKMNSFKRAQNDARQQLGTLSKRDLLMLGLGLYIGEGAKRDELVHIMNSDPDVMRLTLEWIRKILEVPNKHLQLVLHIYPDNSELEAKKYWSGITGIPFSQYGKTQIDRRINKSVAKRRKLPYGTAHVKVRARGILCRNVL